MRRFASENQLLTVAIACIFPGSIAAGVEYYMTGGISGWRPIVAAILGGVATIFALRFLQGSASSETVALPEPAAGSPQAYTPLLGDKVLSRRTPAELAALAKGLTEVAAEYATKPHLGHWLRVESNVWDVSERTLSKQIAVFANDSTDETSLVLYFDSNKWGAHLRTLTVGDRVVSIGKIDSISPSGTILLTDCDLVG